MRVERRAQQVEQTRTRHSLADTASDIQARIEALKRELDALGDATGGGTPRPAPPRRGRQR